MGWGPIIAAIAIWVLKSGVAGLCGGAWMAVRLFQRTCQVALSRMISVVADWYPLEIPWDRVSKSKVEAFT